LIGALLTQLMQLRKESLKKKSGLPFKFIIVATGLHLKMSVDLSLQHLRCFIKRVSSNPCEDLLYIYFFIPQFKYMNFIYA